MVVVVRHTGTSVIYEFYLKERRRQVVVSFLVSINNRQAFVSLNILLFTDHGKHYVFLCSTAAKQMKKRCNLVLSIDQSKHGPSSVVNLKPYLKQ